jgi:hypothetical protein
MSDFRSASGRSAAWHTTRGGFSNFEFIDTRFGSHPILRRIFSLARKARFGGLLVETIEEADCPLLAAENAALALRRPDFQSSTVTRFSFFSGPDEHNPGTFLGYAIFKTDHFVGSNYAHVYEAVVIPARNHTHNNFSHCQRDYTVRTRLGDFTVKGVLYAQQNDATSVCAHVALRSMLASLLPAGDASYADINRLAGVDHADATLRVGGGRGLSVTQIEAVLRGYQLSPSISVHEPGKLDLPAGLEFQRLLYDFIESGRPALLGFELAPHPGTGERSRHVVPIFGHTFNEDLWVPEAERNYFAHDRGFFPSESWLSSYLAHDDNFGPYVCLPRHYLGRDQFRVLIGCHETGVNLPAADAETLAIDVLVFIAQQLSAADVPWFERFRAFTRAGLLVLRAQLVTADTYTAHLRTLRDREGFDLEPALVTSLLAGFPARAWIVEISAPELFPATRCKFGEVLLDASQTDPLAALLAIRLPGHVIRPQPGTLALSRTRLAGHTPLFTYCS